MMEISTIKLVTSVIAGVKFHRAGLSDLPNSFQELQNLGDASPDCSIFFCLLTTGFLSQALLTKRPANCSTITGEHTPEYHMVIT